jgi:hypothetical protein
MQLNHADSQIVQLHNLLCDYLGVSMIQLHGLRLAFTKSKTSFLMMLNLYRVAQHILLKLGVKHHTCDENLFVD